MELRKFLKRFNPVLLLLALFVGFEVSGANLKLAWDANTEADIAGYNLYSNNVSGVARALFVGNQTVTTVSNLVPGSTYSFKVTAVSTSGAESSPSGSVTYTVPPVTTNPTNKAPVVYAGARQAVILPGVAYLQGVVTDDGLPSSPGALTVTWTKVSGKGTVTFANPKSATTTAAFSTRGGYVLRLTAFDGVLRTQSDVRIDVSGKNSSTTTTTLAAESLSTNTSTTLAAKITTNSVPTETRTTNSYSIPMNSEAFLIPFTIDPLNASATLVSARSSNERVVTNSSIIVQYDGNQHTLQVLPATNQAGNVTITVSMTDGIQTQSRSFALVVYDATNHVSDISSLQPGVEGPQLLEMQRTDNTIQLHWSGKPEQRFSVEASRDSVTWTALCASVSENTAGDYIGNAYLKDPALLYFRVREIQTAELSNQ